MYIIAGLGNPGSQYAKTRHNAGFDVIDVLAAQYNIKVDMLKHKALCGAGIIEGNKVMLVKPQTFMNLSGEAVRSVCDFYKINTDNELIVIYDDISLDLGRLRARKKGSAGGHNGIKNIISHIGSENFYRIKVGVGDKPENRDLADYVLSGFSKQDRMIFDDAVKRAAEAVGIIIAGGIEKCMNEINA